MTLNKKRVLSFILSAVMLLTMIPVGVFGADIVRSGTCGGNLTWTLASDGLLTISGTGAMVNYSSSSEVPWYDYRSNIKGIVICNGVTSICSYAFSGCYGLESIAVENGNTVYHSDGNCLIETESKMLILGCKNSVIPTDDSVTSIGSSAFYNCTGLTEITIPDGVTSIGSSAFYGCTGLTEITIPDSVTSIGSSAFYNCTGLTEITIPDSVTSIGEWAFCGCSGLKSVTIPDSVTSIGGYTFYLCSGLKSVTIPDSVTSIGVRAFCGCTGLTEISIPDSVTSIGEQAFGVCKGLTSITIPDSVTSIGNYAFSGCTGLTEIIIPDSVESIGNYAFYGCTGLTEITIPDSVTSIGDSAFYGCTGLTEITIGKSVTSIGNGAFNGCSGLTSVTIGTGMTGIGSAFSDCNNLTTVSFAEGMTRIPNNALSGASSVKTVYIPDSVTSIGDSAFSGCRGLTEITIPDSVTSIGNNAFSRCTRLTEISIPDSVTGIGDSAFYGCTGLTEITIPDSVTSIGGSVFYGCTGLTEITIPDSVKSIGSSAFSGCTGLGSVRIDNPICRIEDSADTIPAKTTIIGYNPSYAKDYADKYSRAFESLGDPPLFVLYSGSCGDDLNWEYDSHRILTISGTGAMVNYSSSSKVPWYDYRSNIKGVVICDGVTSISSYAFFGCTGLTEITIPDSVTSIGWSAFYGCTGLKNITIPDGVTSIGSSAISGCTGLTEISIPDSVTSIGEGSFSGCTGLTSVTIGNGVTSIGYSAFSGCTGLTEITIPDSVTSIESRAFYNTAYYNNDSNWTDGVLYIGNHLIKSRQEIGGNYTVKNGTVSIASYAFSGCAGLTSITIPDSVTSIGNYAFSNCTGLTEITIPDRVTSIGSSAFSGCTGLGSVRINNPVCVITDSATIPAETTIYGYNDSYAKDYADKYSRVFESLGDPPLFVVDSGSCGDDLKWEYDSHRILTISGTGAMVNYSSSSNAPWYNHRSYIKNIVIGDSVASIGDYAFYYCYNLTNLTIPASVTSIGNYAFYFCYNLTNLTIPASVTSIGDYAFRDCTSLTSITIPASVTSIGSYAFHNCYGLRSVTIKKGVKSIGSGAFYGCSRLINIAISDSITSIGADAFANTAYSEDDSNWTNHVLYIGKYLVQADRSEWHVSWSSTVWNHSVRNGTILIADQAFSKSIIDGITIPSSVISIGKSCFSECSYLSYVSIPEGLTTIGPETFKNCSRLEYVFIPDSVTNIDSYAFSGCKSLKYLRLPNNETNISNGAFSGCSALENVTIKDGITSIKSRVFAGCSSLATITIPVSVTSIDEAAFSGCSSLTKVLYAGTEEQWNAINIAHYNDTLTGCSKEFNCVPGPDFTAFGKCGENLIWTLDTNGLLTISGSGNMYDYSYPFKDIDTITEVVIEDGVTSVGSAAFYGCTGLTEITIPDSVTSIGGNAFYGCSSLEGITIPNRVTGVGASAFAQCTGLKAVTLSDGVYSIGASAFSGCTGLTEITIPDSVTSIYSSAFSSCESLRYVKLGSGVMTVGDSAFNNTNSLSTVIIPENVESIGSTAITGRAKKILILNPDITLSDNSISEGTIYGHEDSTAQTYAEQHDLEFVNIDAEPHEHDYFLKDYVKSTEGADGYELWECYCGKSSYKVIIHNYGEWTKLDDDQHQRVCANDSSHVEIKPHTWNDGEITTAATCVAEGVKTYTCTVCNATKTETIAKDASNHVGERELRYVKAANCGNNGYTGDTYCKGCGAKLSNGRTIPATGNHSWTDGEITTAATCKSTGVKKYTCTVCKKTRSETIAKDASNHVGGTEVRDAKAATCGDDGNTGDTYCKGCGAKLSSGTVVNKTGNHSWNSGTVTTAATCKSTGVKTYNCTVCKKTKTETIAKDASKHTGGIDIKNAKVATCGVDGYTGDSYCKGCNTKLKSGTTIPATGKHTWDAGKVTTAATTTSGGKITYTCTVCGQTKTEDTPKLPSTEPTEPTIKPKDEPTTVLPPVTDPAGVPTTDPAANPGDEPKDEPTTILPPPTEPTTMPPASVDEVTMPEELFNLSGDGLTAKETSETLNFASKDPVTAAELIAAATAGNGNATVTVKDKDGNELTGDATPGTGSTVTVTVGNVSVSKTVIVMGDVDGDGKVNATDARLALRAAAKLDTLEGAFAAAADTDGDDNINATDARMILRAAAKLDDPSAWLRAA